MSTSNPNWDAVRDEVTNHLQNLIHLGTINPPGNETLVANNLKQSATAGLESLIGTSYCEAR